jgi:TRAP-type mannitol/chloroaromatic compound transport system substrate-binding protein
VKLRSFPKDLVAAPRKEAKDVLAELAARGERARRVHDSYTAAFRERAGAWSRISLQALFEARDG